MIAASLIIAACGSDDDEEPAPAGPGLRVERFDGPRGAELVVYLARPADNVPETARGADRVRVRCLDSRRRVVVAGSHGWPFTDTDGGLVDAHAHQRVPRAKADSVTSCEIPGTARSLTGRVTKPSY